MNLIIGEAFWDQFEDGSVLMGGSALNVAWNLEALGGESYFVTRFGDDDLGHRMTFEMKKWGMDTHGVQFDTQGLPTGVIKVMMDENKKPTFISPTEIAFDHIEYTQSLDIVSPDYMMYHGTFVLRSPESSATLRKLKNKGHPVFMDLNLRSPYWSLPILEEWTQDLEILKLSDDEFVMMTEQKLKTDDQIVWLQQWMDNRNIQNILFTLGANGAYWVTQDDAFFSHPQKINAINTVGAGDAFCAGVMLSKKLGLSPRDSIEKSSRFAAEICMIPSATSHDKEFYERCRREIWSV